MTIPGGTARRRRAAIAVVLAVATMAASCSSTGSSNDAGGGSSATTAPAAAAPLPSLTAVRGEGARVVDDKGRQVLLRGVNLNVLGDYFQANAKYPTVIPATDADWAEMTADGFNVVRLLVSWSALEPTKGAFDTAYVARIHEAVDAAKAHGIYVVLDMHQDAYGKFVASPPGTVCPDAAKPGIGWDGAPEWATITGGADTCAAAGVRELAPAVMKAFDSFYADTDGIQTELTKTWASLAGAFATDSTIAGYDLFNEPNWGTDIDSSGAKLGAFTQKTIAAIRSAEQAAGGTSHIAFFE
ncbi:MAG TPA: cellulase family glycosylhydrolase, partial [Acidimicrobiales bacterium]